MAALNAGKHVICTKPMCTRVEDAAALVKAVERTGLTFLVGQTMRFGTEFSEAKRLYDAGELGEIIFAEAHYVHDARTFFPGTPWRQTMPQDLMYGGASHPIDVLRWFLGDVVEVQAYGRKSGLIPDYPYEDNYLINLRFRERAGCPRSGGLRIGASTHAHDGAGSLRQPGQPDGRLHRSGGRASEG